MAKSVTYSVGFTRNMGDFESLRIDFGMTEEPREDEKMSEALNRVRDHLDGLLLNAVAEVELDIVEMRKQIAESGEYKRKVRKAAEKAEAEGK